jgi:polysaccharide deacetylase 2 family uncharacterized protein YibQ
VAVAKIEDAVPAQTGSVGADEGAPAPAGSASIPADASVPMGTSTPPATSEEVQLAALPQLPPAVAGDPSLLEYSSYGALPRVSPDGRRPREVYARRAAPVPEGVPKIVIVIGGLGLSQTGTQKALDTLPDDVTLAFAPYGGSLQRWVGKARDAGHEVLLQIPMEPADYPAVNPGEHTLLISGGAANRQDLDWSLGRMTSYAGVMNHMGARFTTDEKAMVPFLGEIGERGLFYLDDGTTPQSLSQSIGKALDVPVLTADRVLDQDRSPDAIQKQLTALEAIARTRGVAIGVGSAFPTTVEAIAAWVKDAASRGIVIVPASGAISPKTDAG